MIYKTDYHIHTTFSDGKSAPEEYIAPAIAAGISEIGFSEHLSLFKENQDWCMNPENVPVIAAASSGLLDIIGHCDLIRIYGFRPSFDPEPLYFRLAKILKKYYLALSLT